MADTCDDDVVDQIIAHLGALQRDMSTMTGILERLSKITVEHSRALVELRSRLDGAPPRRRHRIIRQGR